VLTIIFLPVVVVLQPFAQFAGGTVSVVILVSLLVCLIPTTIGALLSAIGIAGMDRLVQKNVLAMSGRAVEAAGDVQTLLLDKTGTITLGNRMASDFFPASGHTEEEVASAAQLASLADETPEGRSIVVLAKDRFGIREREGAAACPESPRRPVLCPPAVLWHRRMIAITSSGLPSTVVCIAPSSYGNPDSSTIFRASATSSFTPPVTPIGATEKLATIVPPLLPPAYAPNPGEMGAGAAQRQRPPPRLSRQ
jgi:hypothetical protein